ncbi:DUF998 domain-containing protein [Rhodococcus sp. G-MC3]|uniref:DUF998 domain-containing protein n=1 Tax=Rhodococcus sp. G-MC3 TaxID=3046209 RepID=UPI0024BB1E10|nr:DUF998 domain-containing protein [Rhodococcus sp. G-MC3]MDJ0393758.1 DUF998 domain-containing protein [Rhodococcus sp. G-MC3]
MAGSLFGFAAAQYLVLEAVVATVSDGYSYIRDTVSELGVPGTSDASAVMNVAFGVSAVSVLAAGICSAGLLGSRRTPYLAAIAAYSAGTALVATVHAGDGSAHVVGAVMAITAGNVIALVVGTGVPACPQWYRAGSVALGLVGFAASACLIAGIGPVGVAERTAIYTFTGWEMLTAAVLLRTAEQHRTGASPSRGMLARLRGRH